MCSISEAVYCILVSGLQSNLVIMNTDIVKNALCWTKRNQLWKYIQCIFLVTNCTSDISNSAHLRLPPKCACSCLPCNARWQQRQHKQIYKPTHNKKARIYRAVLTAGALYWWRLLAIERWLSLSLPRQHWQTCADTTVLCAHCSSHAQSPFGLTRKDCAPIVPQSNALLHMVAWQPVHLEWRWNNVKVCYLPRHSNSFAVWRVCERNWMWPPHSVFPGYWKTSLPSWTGPVRDQTLTENMSGS